MKKFGWPIICVFYWSHSSNGVLKNFRFFLAESFHKKSIVFQCGQFKSRFSLNFCFASFDSLKAVTGCRVLNLSVLFKYTDLKYKSIFDRTMVWFDKFFLFWAKKIIYLKRSIFALKFHWFDSVTNEWTMVRQGGRVVKAVDCSSHRVCVRGFESHLCRLVS